MTDRRVGDIGEFGLIARIRDLVQSPRPPDGIGDDAAVLDLRGDTLVLATTDSVVEGVHFHPAVPWMAIGRHALAVNLSDIAAMGGAARQALVSLVLPANTTEQAILDVYRGMQELAEKYSVAIVGGNITGTDGPLVIGLTAIGEVPRDEIVGRRGARPGDALCVSGLLGATAADRRAAGNGPWTWQVEPRLEAGRALAVHHLAHAMIDISDGLAADLHHLCEASDVGAVLYEEALPVAIQARQYAEAHGQDPLALALGGGEDYELLVAMAPEAVDRATRAIGALPLSVIGTVLHADQGIVLEREGGAREPLRAEGWRHF